MGDMSETVTTGRDRAGGAKNPVKLGAGNRGREAYMAEARGRRGIMKNHKYTSGKYAGMTGGQADGADMGRWRKTSEKGRDKFRPHNNADKARDAAAAKKAKQEAADFAREEERKTREEIRNERAKYGDGSTKKKPNAETFNPYKQKLDGGGFPIVKDDGSIKANETTATKNPVVNAADPKPTLEQTIWDNQSAARKIKGFKPMETARPVVNATPKEDAGEAGAKNKTGDGGVTGDDTPKPRRKLGSSFEYNEAGKVVPKPLNKPSPVTQPVTQPDKTPRFGDSKAYTDFQDESEFEGNKTQQRVYDELTAKRAADEAAAAEAEAKDRSDKGMLPKDANLSRTDQAYADVDHNIVQKRKAEAEANKYVSPVTSQQPFRDAHEGRSKPQEREFQRKKLRTPDQIKAEALAEKRHAGKVERNIGRAKEIQSAKNFGREAVGVVGDVTVGVAKETYKGAKEAYKGIKEGMQSENEKWKNKGGIKQAFR